MSMSSEDEDSDVVCRPLESLEQVWGWEAGANAHLTAATLPLHPRLPHSTHQPRTLLCHDMKGGYLDDRLVQGGADPLSYRFFHWSHVDVYVYFSHSFITVPPPAWIDAAHLHGVPVLGTLITEGEGGASICRTLFNARDPYLIRNFIQKLVDIAQHFRFEGWLINIENPVDAEQVRNMQNFLYWLTVKMREAVTSSYVIWYDSVTIDGELKWQNELNNFNKVFFDACDGIYLNYNWDEDKLSRTVSASGQRVADVYVGVDVFGRGTLGGGGFNSDVAFKAIRNQGLSLALFAPGWVHEVLGASAFTQNEYKFWSLLTDFSPLHGPAHLPFSTSFCQGFGDKLFRRGKELSDRAWCNGSLQQYQPTDHAFYSRDHAPHSFSVSTEHGYSGGGCLRVSGTGSPPPPLFTLLTCEFQLKLSLLLTYTFRWVAPPEADATPPSLALCLALGDKGGQAKAQLLLGAEGDEGAPPGLPAATPVTLLRPIEPHLVPDLQRQGIRIPRKPEAGWITRCYILSPDYGEAYIRKLSLHIALAASSAQDDYQLLLGQLQLIPMHLLLEAHQVEVTVAHLAVSRLSSTQSMSVTCIVRWGPGSFSFSSPPQPPHALLQHYDLSCRLLWREGGRTRSLTRFVDATRRSAYKVRALPLPYPPDGRFSLRFIVQEHCAGLQVPDLDSAPYAQLSFD